MSLTPGGIAIGVRPTFEKSGGDEANVLPLASTSAGQLLLLLRQRGRRSDEANMIAGL